MTSFSLALMFNLIFSVSLKKTQENADKEVASQTVKGAEATQQTQTHPLLGYHRNCLGIFNCTIPAVQIKQTPQSKACRTAFHM